MHGTQKECEGLGRGCTVIKTGSKGLGMGTQYPEPAQTGLEGQGGADRMCRRTR
jgi:hypothetical protein